MALLTAGLATYRWNNNVRSIFLIALYPIIVLGVCYAVFLAAAVFLQPVNPGNPVDLQSAQGVAQNWLYQFWPTILSVVGVWFTISYFFQTRFIEKLSNSHNVTKEEEPELYNLLENLCISQGIPTPKIHIIETHACNAFASGTDTGSYAVTVSRGLLRRLTRDELECVLAHELTHIIRNDVRLLIVSIIITGFFGFMAQMAWNIVRASNYTSARREKGNGIVLFLILVAVILYLGHLTTIWSRFALSRRREFDADAGAIEMTKNPDAMMRALQRISGRDQLPEGNADIALMCIENTAKFWGLFATHPPIDARLQAIANVGGVSVPTLEDLQLNYVPFENPQGINANPWRTFIRRSR